MHHTDRVCYRSFGVLIGLGLFTAVIRHLPIESRKATDVISA